jgi:hypothetical protein
MATYIRRRELGDDAKQAADVAREQFIDYDIRAPWVNAARNTVLPFISYTYRAAPLIARAVATRPWKLGKYFLLAYALNALAYALTGGDEDKERRSLREKEQGRTWIGTYQMTRMPVNDRYGNPIFLDIRRWVPAGDVFDTGRRRPFLPAWLNLGGPLMIGAELALNRRPSPARRSSTTRPTIGGTAPANAPTTSTSRGCRRPRGCRTPGIGRRSRTPRRARPIAGPALQPAAALSSSVGVKLKPQDVDDDRFCQVAWKSPSAPTTSAPACQL